MVYDRRTAKKSDRTLLTNFISPQEEKVGAKRQPSLRKTVAHAQRAPQVLNPSTYLDNDESRQGLNGLLVSPPSRYKADAGDLAKILKRVDVRKYLPIL